MPRRAQKSGSFGRRSAELVPSCRAAAGNPGMNVIIMISVKQAAATPSSCLWLPLVIQHSSSLRLQSSYDKYFFSLFQFLRARSWQLRDGSAHPLPQLQIQWSAIKSRIASNPPPSKSQARALSRAMAAAAVSTLVNGKSQGISASDEALIGVGLDEAPKSPVKGHKKLGSRGSRSSLKSKSKEPLVSKGESEKPVVYEQVHSINGSQLVSVKPSDDYESELQLDDAERKRKVSGDSLSLTSGRQPSAGWERSGYGLLQNTCHCLLDPMLTRPTVYDSRLSMFPSNAVYRHSWC
jgi:hypothetical protein